jgi:hypothetical protein
VEIGAAQFLFWEYLFPIFSIGSLQCNNLENDVDEDAPDVHVAAHVLRLLAEAGVQLHRLVLRFKKMQSLKLTKPEMEFLDGIFSRGCWAKTRVFFHSTKCYS